jgi:hypothetical protein
MKLSEQSRNVLFFGKVEMSYLVARPPVHVLPFPPLRNSSRIAAWCRQGRLPLRRREALTAGRDAG